VAKPCLADDVLERFAKRSAGNQRHKLGRLGGVHLGISEQLPPRGIERVRHQEFGVNSGARHASGS